MAEKRNKKRVGATKGHKVGRTCLVCDNPKRDEYDQALALGKMTPAQVARKISVHRSSVTRHMKNHLLPQVRADVEEDPTLGQVNILDELRNLYRRMRLHLERAEKADNWQAIRGFHSEARQDLELLAKLLGQLDERPQVNLLVSNEWAVIRMAIMQALEPYPDARLAVAKALTDDNTPH